MIIYQLNAGGGFFSTFFFVCKAYLTALKQREAFFIEDRGWPYTCERGWHDYMRSLETPPLLRLNARVVTHNTQRLDPEFRLEDYRVACHDLFKLGTPLVERVHQLIRSMDSTYVAIFVRRGDKLNEEAEYIAVEDILSAIPHTAETPFFIQTDDYTVVEEFRRIHPSHLIHTTVPPTKRGQYLTRTHLAMDSGRNPNIAQVVPVSEQSPSQLREETNEMLVGLSVCYLAPSCWTDNTSNVGRFLKLMAPDTVHVYPNDTPLDLSLVHCPSVNFQTHNIST